MRTLALATTVFEEEVHAERDEIPFIHSTQDLETLKDAEQELKRKISLVSSFEDMHGLMGAKLEETLPQE